MATYVIGDIQGCYYAFRQLLAEIHFDEHADRLWLVGDIVNRGAHSVEVLRWCHTHQSSLVVVLGNHDLHTLAVAEGFVPLHKSDTLDELLAAPDRDQLLGWLRQQRMVHLQDGYLLVHAGLLPQWSAQQAAALGAEVEQALHGERYREFLAQMYGNQPDHWHAKLSGIDRLRLITNAMTRLRVCDAQGAMDFRFKGELQDVPTGYRPWFDVPKRKSADTTIIFGHWSALGLLQRQNLYALDTGCLWGGQLTALRLDDKRIFQVPCQAADSPRKI